MKIIVTGATGFIGRALCKEMLENNHDVTAVIRPGSKKRELLPQGVKVVELELDKLNELNELKEKFDIFYHLAWNGSSGDDRNDFYIQNSNITYNAEAVKAAKVCGCKKFIGAGSQAEYGVVRNICTEDTNTNPFMMYGAAKLASYHMSNILAKQLKISFVWARIYSVYGIGENEGTLVNYMIKMLKKNKSPELSCCENMWDYIYITDCVRALRMLGECKRTEGIYNISNGNPKILKEFVKDICDIVNSSVEVKFGVKQSVEERTFWLEPNIEKIEKIGFYPKVEFKEGIKYKL